MDPFELRLANVLRAEADRGVAPIDAMGIAKEAMRSPVPRDRRRPWPPSAVAALLLTGAVLGSAVLLGGAPDGEDTSQPPGPSTLAVALRRVSGPAGDIEVLGLAPGRADQALVTLRGDELPDASAYGTTGAVSERGALAVQVDRSRYALSSIGDPGGPPVIVPYGAVIGGRWSTTDVLATVAQGPGAWPMQAVTLDGTVRPFGPVDLPGGGPDIIWAADGSGVLARSAEGYGIVPIDGGPFRPGVPALSYGGRPRWIVDGGTAILRCDEPESPPDCSGVYTRRDLEAPQAWIPDPSAAPGRLADASFASDGRSLWLLFDRGTGDDRAAVFVHAPAPGRLTTMATVPIPAATALLSFGGFSADDALIVIGHAGPDGRDPATILVEPATGHWSSTGETVIGFVSQPTRPSPSPSRPVPTIEVDDPPATDGPTTTCAAMDRILAGGPTIHAQNTIPAGSPNRTVGATDILYTTTRDDGTVGSMRLDVSGTPLTPGEVADRRFPETSQFPHDPLARFVPSPDGSAIAVEEGDLGPGGCGDPLILLADGGALRPFRVRRHRAGHGSCVGARWLGPLRRPAPDGRRGRPATPGRWDGSGAGRTGRRPALGREDRAGGHTRGVVRVLRPVVGLAWRSVRRDG